MNKAPILPKALLALAALLIVLFGVAAYSEAMLLPGVDDSDEPGYLDEATWIAEHGGVAGFFGACLRGELPFEYRHPLVQLLVAPWAERSLEAIRPVRAAHVALSVACVAALFFLCRRIMPLHAALAFTALVALSRNWYMKSRVLCVEPLIYLLFFLAWALIAGLWKPRGRWLWAGAAVGLAFLGKGTAILLLVALVPAMILSWIVDRRSRNERQASPEQVSSSPQRPFRISRSVALFVLGFILLASPLLIRNTVRYGNPLFNRNSELMWADDYGAHLMTEAQRAEKPLTLGRYLREHTVGDMVKRLAVGVKLQTPRFIGSLAADQAWGWPVFAPTLLFSGALVFLGLWALVEQRRTWLGIYTACLLGVAFLLFSWHHPITHASRFIATLGPVVGALAFCAGPRAFWRRLERWRAVAVPAAIVTAGLAVLLLAGRVERAGLVRPVGHVPESPEYFFLRTFYEREIIEAGKACVETPYLAPRFTFQWIWSNRGLIFDMPPFRTFEALQVYLDGVGAEYLVVERDSLADRRELLAPYVGLDADGRLRVWREPPGWRLDKVDVFGEPDFVIFKRAG